MEGKEGGIEEKKVWERSGREYRQNKEKNEVKKEGRKD